MKLDLNLLIVFEAVARFGSVTVASDHLALSQSAVSHALNRLRTKVGDPLFTRHGRKLVATPRAEAMIGPVSDVMLRAIQLLSPEKFDPFESKRIFRVGASDYAAMILVPDLVRAIHEIAPHVTLEIVSVGRDTLSQLEDGALDLSFWGALPPGNSFHHLTLFEEHYVGVACAAHSMFRKNKTGVISLAQYLDASHAVVSLRDPGVNQIDSLLALKGRVRKTGLASHSFINNMVCLNKSDLIATLPLKLCQSTLMKGLRVFELPFDVPPYSYGIVWHARTNAAPGHIWLRDMVLRISKQC
jgi:DNA-binding transcriptional LysR family regulator